MRNINNLNPAEIYFTVIGIFIILVSLMVSLFIFLPVPINKPITIDQKLYTMSVNRSDNLTSVDIIFTQGMELKAGTTYQIDLTPVLEQWKKNK